MQVGDEIAHLLVVESSCEPGHHAAAVQDIEPHSRVRGGNATGKCWVIEDAVQVRRSFLERQIVFLMAVSAAHLVEVLPRCLLRGQLGLGMTAEEKKDGG